MTETLAKRSVSIILIAVGIRDDRVAKTAGRSERSVWTIRKSLVRGDISNLFEVGGGSGRPVKIKELERAIIDEGEKNNYHTRQQIAEQIY